MQSLVVAVVDVGAPQNIGWWRQVEGDGRGGTNLDELGLLLAEDLNAGRSVALGFEAPMFIPRPLTAGRLSRGRVGEGRWPWSGGPGTSVLASGIQQSTYLLSTLRVNGLYALEWGERVLIRGGVGRSGQVMPPAWSSTRSR